MPQVVPARSRVPKCVMQVRLQSLARAPSLLWLSCLRTVSYMRRRGAPDPEADLPILGVAPQQRVAVGSVVLDHLPEHGPMPVMHGMSNLSVKVTGPHERVRVDEGTTQVAGTDWLGARKRQALAACRLEGSVPWRQPCCMYPKALPSQAPTCAHACMPHTHVQWGAGPTAGRPPAARGPSTPYLPPPPTRLASPLTPWNRTAQTILAR